MLKFSGSSYTGQVWFGKWGVAASPLPPVSVAVWDAVWLPPPAPHRGCADARTKVVYGWTSATNAGHAALSFRRRGWTHTPCGFTRDSPSARCAQSSGRRGVTDTDTGMLQGSAICVQRFDDSLSSAIRTTYRISLRSSSS